MIFICSNNTQYYNNELLKIEDYSKLVMSKCYFIVFVFLIFFESISFLFISFARETFLKSVNSFNTDKILIKDIKILNSFMRDIMIKQLFLTILLFGLSFFLLKIIFIYYFDIYVFENLNFSLYIISFIVFYTFFKSFQLFYINKTESLTLISSNLYDDIIKYINKIKENDTVEHRNKLYDAFKKVMLKFFIISVYIAILTLLINVLLLYFSTYQYKYLYILIFILLYLILPLILLFILDCLIFKGDGDDKFFLRRLLVYMLFKNDDNEFYISEIIYMFIYYLFMVSTLLLPYIYEIYFSNSLY